LPDPGRSFVLQYRSGSKMRFTFGIAVAAYSVGCDLSGLITIGSDKNFDHVVPLAQGGLNDVTNFQLLCDSCNSKKGAGDALTSDFYQALYDLQGKS
jgi:hypothetical protein